MPITVIAPSHDLSTIFVVFITDCYNNAFDAPGKDVCNSSHTIEQSISHDSWPGCLEGHAPHSPSRSGTQDSKSLCAQSGVRQDNIAVHTSRLGKFDARLKNSAGNI